MTDKRPATGALQMHALVHEKGGGPSMYVVGITDSPQARFVHVVYRDEANEAACATFRDEDLVVVVPANPEGDR